jgi:mannitol/fructose-specific phosphotransferase system IIA component
MKLLHTLASLQSRTLPAKIDNEVEIMAIEEIVRRGYIQAVIQRPRKGQSTYGNRIAIVTRLIKK